jgi:hypothetical protein
MVTVFLVLSNIDISNGVRATVPSNDKNVELTKHAFRLYNPEISDTTIATFVTIAKAYGLCDDEDVFRKCLSQICLESQARSEAISSGNAMGMGQIVPNTAFNVLHKIDSIGMIKMVSLGVSDIQWAIKGKYMTVEDSAGKRIVLPSHLREKTKKWLSNERNNIILWAHIMSRDIQKKGFDRALLSYRMGEGGAASYEGSPKNHPYLKRIYLISKKLSKKKKGVN